MQSLPSPHSRYRWLDNVLEYYRQITPTSFRVVPRPSYHEVGNTDLDAEPLDLLVPSTYVANIQYPGYRPNTCIPYRNSHVRTCMVEWVRGNRLSQTRRSNWGAGQASRPDVAKAGATVHLGGARHSGTHKNW